MAPTYPEPSLPADRFVIPTRKPIYYEDVYGNPPGNGEVDFSEVCEPESDSDETDGDAVGHGSGRHGFFGRFRDQVHKTGVPKTARKSLQNIDSGGVSGQSDSPEGDSHNC